LIWQNHHLIMVMNHDLVNAKADTLNILCYCKHAYASSTIYTLRWQHSYAKKFFIKYVILISVPMNYNLTILCNNCI